MMFIAVMTIVQSFRRWHWPWAPVTIEGTNGRWKLDWSISIFLLLISIDYQMQFFDLQKNHDTMYLRIVFHTMVTIASLTVFWFMKKEHDHQKENGDE
jgi:hypothetical protein